jgi:hypothetical protein
MTTDTIFCGLLSDSKFGGEIKTFSERKSRLPAVLVNHINEVREMKNNY